MPQANPKLGAVELLEADLIQRAERDRQAFTYIRLLVSKIYEPEVDLDWILGKIDAIATEGCERHALK